MIKNLGFCKTMPIGSFPQKSAEEATRLCLENFDIPCWVQLPKLGFKENIYAQSSEGIKSIVIKDEKIYADTSNEEKLMHDIEKILKDFIESKNEDYKITREFAQGLYYFLEKKDELSKKEFIKGQIIGPVSFGLQVCDQNKKPVLYNNLLFEAITRALTLKTKWMLEKMKTISKNVVISVDEPFLSSFGSAYVNLTKEQVIKNLNIIFEKLDCVKAMHCCANTNWGILMQMNVDVICFDAYEYAKNLMLFPVELKHFIERGGIMGWGIVPSSNDLIKKENADTLFKKFQWLIKEFTAKGINEEELLKQSLLTPSCGVGSLTEDASVKVCKTIKKLSQKIRESYSLK